MQESNCKKCGAKIIWARTAASWNGDAATFGETMEVIAHFMKKTLVNQETRNDVDKLS